MQVQNILLVGVGGQGTILVSKILSMGLIDAGYDVKMSEVHGMAQRGGSVSSQVRYGEKIYSPIISKGQADILVSFETMEALRWLEYINPKGKAIVNDYHIPSAPILMGKAEYPAGVLKTIQQKVDTTIIRAGEIAEKLGNAKSMNLVLFGALVKVMKLANINWQEVIKKSVQASTVNINIEAFKAGVDVIDTYEKRVS